MRRSDSHRLSGFGLSIESDRDVPGTLPDPSPAGTMPDLRITTLAPLSPAALPQAVYCWENEVLTFSAQGVGRYFCRRDAIDVAAEQGGDPGMVAALLIATALPALLWLRGDTMLHAAGVVAPSGRSALAIAGPSGIGKSALIAQLVADGGSLLADDSICLRRRNDEVEGSGLPSGYHLRQADDRSRDFHATPPGRAIRAATIGAVVILGRTGGVPMLTRLDPIAALEGLLANLHRPAVPALIGRRAETLATMAFIARNLAVYEWHRSAVGLSIAEREMLAREGLW
jgi:hypothetical protein